MLGDREHAITVTDVTGSTVTHIANKKKFLSEKPGVGVYDYCTNSSQTGFAFEVTCRFPDAKVEIIRVQAPADQ